MKPYALTQHGAESPTRVHFGAFSSEGIVTGLFVSAYTRRRLSETGKPALSSSSLLYFLYIIWGISEKTKLVFRYILILSGFHFNVNCFFKNFKKLHTFAVSRISRITYALKT